MYRVETEMNYDTLVKKAEPVMVRLEEEFGETVALASLDFQTGQGVVLSEKRGTSGLCLHLERGFNMPIHVASACKAMLAFMQHDQLEHYLDLCDFKPFTNHSVSNKQEMLKNIHKVAEVGYATDCEEAMIGFHCVAVPVFNAEGCPIAGLWVTGRKENLQKRYFKRIAEQLRKGANEISLQMFSGFQAEGDCISRAQKLMADNLITGIAMEEVARAVNVGYSWFRKEFKLKTGMSPNEYLLQLKIAEIKELLRSSDATASEIAQKLKFSSSHYMSNLFKQKTGLTPIEYRKAHKTSEDR